ncbi:MAG: hypothetical protein U0520_01885 [Candidatus Saccharimonadales bacterium]
MEAKVVDRQPAQTITSRVFHKMLGAISINRRPEEDYCVGQEVGRSPLTIEADMDTDPAMEKVGKLVEVRIKVEASLGRLSQRAARQG